jgi:hypothetical protein
MANQEKDLFYAVLRNRTYLLQFQFRFQLLTIYGSVSVIYHKRDSFQKTKKNPAFLYSKLFYEAIIDKLHQFYCKM